MEYLIFRIYGALGSWGNTAVGESRHSLAEPTKSALLGLVAAALGIRREEETTHARMASGYHVAVKLLTAGRFLKDFHTCQVPPSSRKRSYRTRREELVIGRRQLGTLLSAREYRCDLLALVALRALEAAPYPLETVLAALQKPRFHLYIGRKSCPLGAPLNPQLIAADGIKTALDSYVHGQLLPFSGKRPDGRHHLTTDEKRWLPLGADVRYIWEGVVEDFLPQATQEEMDRMIAVARYDQPLSRDRWQFAQRNVHVYHEEEQV